MAGRRGSFRETVGFGRADADARGPRSSASGLGIESVERALLVGEYTGAAHFTDTNPIAAFEDVSPANLAWFVWLSGKRPVELSLTVTVSVAAGDSGQWSIAVDGVEVTGLDNGMVYSGLTGVVTLSSRYVIMDAVAGRHRVSVVWKGTGTGTLTTLADASNRVLVVVKEV